MPASVRRGICKLSNVVPSCPFHGSQSAKTALWGVDLHVGHASIEFRLLGSCSRVFLLRQRHHVASGFAVVVGVRSHELASAKALSKVSLCESESLEHGRADLSDGIHHHVEDSNLVWTPSKGNMFFAFFLLFWLITCLQKLLACSRIWGTHAFHVLHSSKWKVECLGVEWRDLLGGPRSYNRGDFRKFHDGYHVPLLVLPGLLDAHGSETILWERHLLPCSESLPLLPLSPRLLVVWHLVHLTRPNADLAHCHFYWPPTGATLRHDSSLGTLADFLPAFISFHAVKKRVVV